MNQHFFVVIVNRFVALSMNLFGIEENQYRGLVSPIILIFYLRSMWATFEDCPTAFAVLSLKIREFYAHEQHIQQKNRKSLFSDD